jgi:hypothetical protein
MTPSLVWREIADALLCRPVGGSARGRPSDPAVSDRGVAPALARPSMQTTIPTPTQEQTDDR